METNKKSINCSKIESDAAPFSKLIYFVILQKSEQKSKMKASWLHSDEKEHFELLLLLVSYPMSLLQLNLCNCNNDYFM